MGEGIPQWALDRVEQEAGPRPRPECIPEDEMIIIAKAFARYIAAHEQPPVDPEWEAIFQALRAYEQVRANGLLSNEGIDAALTAFRKHKEAGK